MKRYGAPLRTKSTGLVRRFGCVLAMLASVLTWGSAPVCAADDDGDLGRHKVRVLTQNMYVGTSLGALTGATTPQQLREAITALPQKILATKPAERAAAMAAEIAKQRPDFVALHEAWMLSVGGTVKMDLLQSLLDALKALGQPYALAGTVTDEDIDFTPLGLATHLRDRDAILMRTDVDIVTINVQSPQFSKPIITPTPLPPPFNQIITHSGYVWVDANVRGLPLRFVSVHLIPNPGTILAHTTELLAANSTSSLPLVFGGDFNTTADDPSDPSYAIYQALTDPKVGGYLTDA